MSMFKFVLVVLVIVRHVSCSSLHGQSYELRLEINGDALLYRVRQSSVQHVVGNVEELLQNYLDHRTGAPDTVVEAKHGKNRFDHKVLTMLLRIEKSVDSRFTDNAFEELIRNSIKAIEKKQDFHINQRLWIVAPRTIALERCLALLESDCNNQGSGCLPVELGRADKDEKVKFPEPDKKNHDHQNDQMYPQPTQWTALVATKPTNAPKKTVVPKFAKSSEVSGKVLTHYFEPNESFTVDCPNGSWRRDGGLSPQSQVLANGTLVVKNVSYLDSGIYLCKIDGRTRFMFDTVVLRKRVTVSIRPQGGDKLKFYTQHTGDSFFMVCVVDPIEAGNVLWSRFGGDKMSNNVVIKGNRLEIRPVTCQDHGKYYCTIDRKLPRQVRDYMNLQVIDTKRLELC